MALSDFEDYGRSDHGTLQAVFMIIAVVLFFGGLYTAAIVTPWGALVAFIGGVLFFVPVELFVLDAFAALLRRRAKKIITGEGPYRSTKTCSNCGAHLQDEKK